MNKLAIVGSHPDTRESAPFHDPSFDIWVLNEAANAAWCKRWDACFQMHEPEIYTGHNTKDPKHWEWLQKKHNKPIYMQEIDPRIPDSRQYPLQEAHDLVGFTYLSSTIAMTCALVVLQGYKHVEFWGIDLSMTEYKSQAECIRFWIGFLKGKLGAEHVVLHCAEHLFKAPLYGYEGNYAFGAEYFTGRVKSLDSQWHSADKHARNMREAVERAIFKADFQKVPPLVKDYQSAVMECGELAGALAEAERYSAFGNRYADRGGFEYAAAKAQQDGEEKRVLMWTMTGKVEYMWNVWTQTKSLQARDQLLGFIRALGELAQDTGAMLGMYRENIAYINKYDDIIQAGGKVLLEVSA